MVLIQKSPDAFQASRVGWRCRASFGAFFFFFANYLVRIYSCQKEKKRLSWGGGELNKQTNTVQKQNLFQAVVKVLEGEHKAKSKHTQGSVFSGSLSLEAWTGPLSDPNLQPVCWHVDNTCSYAWLRHIRLWNSTSSTGPLTICHFLHIFSIMALFVSHATGCMNRGCALWPLSCQSAQFSQSCFRQDATSLTRRNERLSFCWVNLLRAVFK